MHSTKIFTAGFFVIWMSLCKAQSSLAIDMQINRDVFGWKDEGNELRKSLGLNVSPAILYRLSFGKKIALSTGLRVKLYPNGITFKKIPGKFTNLGDATLQIPFYLEKQFSLYKDKLFLSPMFGVNYNFLLTSGDSREGFTSNLSDSVRFKSTNVNQNNSFFSAMGGFCFEFRFTPRNSVALYWQYTRGFTNVASQTISYRVNEGAQAQAKQTNTGTYFTYLGLRIYHHFPRKIKTVNDKKE